MTKELKLIPPSDPRVLSAIAPFKDDMLKEHDFKDRKDLTNTMFETIFHICCESFWIFLF